MPRKSWFLLLSAILLLFAFECGTKDGPSGPADGTPDTTPPAAPTGISAVPNISRWIYVSWDTAGASADISHYTVYKEDTAVCLTNMNCFYDTGLQLDTTYCYNVSATDSAGNESGLSSTACAVITIFIDSVVPTAPDITGARAASNTSVELTWSAATDNIGVTGYIIYRDGGECGRTTALIFIDTLLSVNTTYCYVVKATDSAGNISAGQPAMCVTTNIGYDSIAWKCSTGTAIYYSSPAIGTDGTVYVGTSQSPALCAVNPDGSVKWRYAIPNPVFTPAVAADGTIYVQDNTATLYSITSGGGLNWSLPFSKTHAIGQTAPAIGSDGTVYIGADSLYAINPDQSVKWGFWPPGPYEFITIIHSSPACAQDGTVFVGATGSFEDTLANKSGPVALLAVTSGGTLKWECILDGADFVFSSPAVGADGTVYIGAEQGTGRDSSFVYAVDSSGVQKWRHVITGGNGRTIRSSPAIGLDGTIFIGTKSNPDSNAMLLALDPADGSRKFRFVCETAGADIYCSPAIGADGVVYFGAENGIVYAINSDGTEKWRYSTGNGINWSSPAIGADSTLYIGNNNGDLFALRTSSNGPATSPWPKFRKDNQNTGRYLP